MTVAWPARAVLIDLDGTLLDTVPDIAAAVNEMLGELGRAALPVATVAAYIGKGADGLVHRVLPGAHDGPARALGGPGHVEAQDLFAGGRGGQGRFEGPGRVRPP